jgi:glucosamine-phosphate N-acetyltransferase
MTFTNRSDSRTTYNPSTLGNAPITTRTNILDSSALSKYNLNRSSNASTNSNIHLPPITKPFELNLNAVKSDFVSSSSIFGNNQWRIMPDKHQKYFESKLQKYPSVPKMNGQIFTYFPSTKPFIREDQLIKYDISLFDTRIFKKIRFEDFITNTDGIKLIKMNGSEYCYDLGNNLLMRSLKIDDFDRDYLKLLEQLDAFCDNITKERFEERFFDMKSCLNTYFIIVIEDLSTNKVIGSAALINEQKFINNISSRGRIEDIVVDESYRGNHLGKLLLDFLIDICKIIGCSVLSLECDDDLKSYYQQFQFKGEFGNNLLTRRL